MNYLEHPTKVKIKLILYIKNIKYLHLTNVFRKHKTCPHKFKWSLCTSFYIIYYHYLYVHEFLALNTYLESFSKQIPC
jgi:hypothetical protein